MGNATVSVAWVGVSPTERRSPRNGFGGTPAHPTAPTPTRNATASSPKAPADVLDHATSEIAIGSKLGIDATKKLPGEGFKRPWPPLIRIDEATRKKIDALFGC